MLWRLDRGLGGPLVVATIVAYGYWGWAVHDGWTRSVWAIGSMVVAATVWDVLRVRGDGAAPIVAVPGWVRLIIEAAYFTGVATAIVSTGAPGLGLVFIILVAIHYTLTHRRVAWLLREGAGD